MKKTQSQPPGFDARTDSRTKDFRATGGRLAVILLTLTVCLPLLDCTSRQERDDRFAEIRSKIRNFMEDGNVSSVSVAVAQHGDIVWEEAFGWANRERNVKATTETRYEIASVARVFTATGLMALRERSLVNLDAPVQSYLGEASVESFSVDPSGVTLRRILQQTSGLPMYWGEPSTDETGRSVARMDILKRYAILAFTPGEREIYSNLGTAMAIQVIEQVSNKTYKEFLQQEIFFPLALKNTAHLSGPPATDEYAQQYTENGDRWQFPEGTYASAHDMLRFCMFHLKHRFPDQKPILSDSSIELMQTAIDPVSDYRLPWSVWQYRDYHALVSTGASGAIIAIAPEADLAIVVLANRLQAATPKICGWIADVMLENSDESKRIPTQIRKHQKTMPVSLTPEGLRGAWKGAIRAPERMVPVEIRFGDPGGPSMRSMEASTTWGEWVAAMSSLRGDYSGGIFSAHFPLYIPAEDTRAHDHWTWIYVGRKADTLQGYAVAHAADGPHFGLPYYIRLVRDGSSNEDSRH